MKKTQIIELLNIIKSTKVTFLSIVMFVALAVAFFAGITWSTDGIKVSIHNEVEEAKLYDLEITYPYGFTNDDVKKICKIDGVDEAEAIRTSCQFIKIDGSNNQIEITQAGNKLNRFIEIDGSMPKNENEIAVEKNYAEKHNIKIGDKLSFTCDDGGEMKHLETNEFKVSAIVISPLYVAKATSYLPDSFAEKNITIDGFMFVNGAAFKEDSFSGYSSVYLRSNTLRDLNTFSDEYADAIDDFIDTIKPEINKITDARYKSICDDLDLDIADLDFELSDGFNKIRTGESELRSAQSEIGNAKAKVRKGENALNELNATITKYTNDLKSLDAQIEQIKNVSGPDSPELIELNKKREELSYAISQAKSQRAEQSKKLKSAKASITSGERTIARNKGELSAAKEQYYEGIDAFDELNDTRDKLKKCDSGISPRTHNSGIASLSIIADIFGKIRFTLAALFLVVGLLVCYSASSRLVYDHMSNIGVKKALGMPNRSITTGYLSYSGAAVLIGGIISCILSLVLVEPSIYKGIRSLFYIKKNEYVCTFSLASLCIVGELILILMFTWLACRIVLKKKAIALLADNEIKYEKQRFFEEWNIWKKTPLFYKTMINNCLNDKRRVFATIVGVAGCTALMVCAITLDSNINNSFIKHFDDVYHFDNVAYYIDDNSNEDTSLEIQKVLSNNGVSSTVMESCYAAINMPDGQNIFTHVFVPNQDNFDDFVSILPSGTTLSKPGEGVWMNLSYAKEFDVEAGDKIELVDVEGQTHQVKIDGFYEHYLTRHQLIMSPDSFEEIFGKKPEANSVAFASNGKDVIELERQLSKIDGFISLNKYQENSRSSFEAFIGISKIMVTVNTIMAIAMALLVLLNLFIMFVDEKKREVVTMMINGFSQSQVRVYLYRDAIFLTIVGIIIGLIVGTIMGNVSVHSFESSTTYFLKGIVWKACAIGASCSAAFAFITMKIALKRASNFKLTDYSAM